MIEKKRRISGEARRNSIIRAARGAFAENGFRGTTTRALAEAAGVSEALLFKHFPSKEALHAAMLASYTRDLGVGGFRELEGMEPSTATLVRLVHTFYSSLIAIPDQVAAREVATLARLMFRSLTEDGAFARAFLRQVPSRLVVKLEECMVAAVAAGDLERGPVAPSLAAWFTHHLAVILMLNRLPNPPALDYGVPPGELVERAVWFVLRGIGLKDEAIRKFYRPTEWAKRRS